LFSKFALVIELYEAVAINYRNARFFFVRCVYQHAFCHKNTPKAAGAMGGSLCDCKDTASQGRKSVKVYVES
jgi:hypothetical protein